MNKKKVIGSTLIVILIIVIGAVAFFTQQSNNSSEPVDTTNNETNTEETEQMPVEGNVLNSLPEGSYEIQDNTITDTWGVVLHVEKLPEELKGAESYEIKIGEKSYALELNPYNDKVYNGQVSSLDHSEEEVGQGVVTKK